MKVCVITPLYAIAGVPLAQLRFAKALARHGHKVDFIIGRVDAECPLPPISGVNVIVLGKRNVRTMLVPIIQYLRTNKPDLMFSAEDHLNSMVLLAAIVTRSRARISASSRVTPFDTYSNIPFTKRWILKQVARITMWRADALTCVSMDMVDQYRKVFRSGRHTAVYNIVDDAASRLRIHEPLEDEWFEGCGVPVLVAAGRLAPWKGFADLIHAVKIVSKHCAVRLIILGDGPLKAELDHLIDELGLSHMVRLMGYVENPLKYFSRADVFVLSSHVEGLPNVLVEAMMCGCTPVATDCATGPREVLNNGAYGYLVPVKSPPEMAVAIEAALSNPISKDKLAEAIKPFEETAVIQRHFQLLGIPQTG